MAWKRNTVADIERLSRQLRSTNRERRVEATEKLCTAFEPLVQSLVKRYQQALAGAEHDELEQTARVGLLEACRTFNRKRGAFQTHATWSIRSALAIYIGNLANPVRVPRKLTFYLPKLRRLTVQLSHTLMRRPTLEELSKALGKTEDAVIAMLAYNRGPVSLSYPVPFLPGSIGPSNERYEDAESWVEGLPSETLTPEEELIAREEATALTRIVGRRRKVKSA